jgi:tRNA-splicing ligase RtcB (3'-phosphate/5'-hydroxy nucleic acid ligase)
MLEITGEYASCKIFNDGVEEEAIKQIYGFLNHPAFENSNIRIMPDVHAGKGAVIGFTSSMGTKVIPNIIGVDIGCGVNCYNLGKIDINFSLFDEYLREHMPFGCRVRNKQTARNITDNAYKIIKENDKTLTPLSGEFIDIIKKVAINTNQDENYVVLSLGTLGSGNHFAELNIDQNDNKYLTIHTGSRNFGLKIATYHQKIANEKNHYGELSYLTDTDAEDYCRHMTIATRFARFNREIIGQTLLRFFDIQQPLGRIESVHNYIDFEDGIIRKGAISAKKDELVIIPWNMRDGSIVGLGKGNDDWNQSAPHGAGRIMGRNVAKKTLDIEEFKSTMAGVWSSCINAGTLDESPMAYKNSEEIKELLEPTVKIITTLKPIYNFKASE